jgi:hypothetical protein
MKGARITGSVLLVVAGLTLVASGATAAPFDIRDYFPLNQGDTWTYEHRQGGRIVTAALVSTIDGTKKLDGVEYVVRTKSNGEIAYFRHGSKGVENKGGKSKSPIGLVDWSASTPIYYPAACMMGRSTTQKTKGVSGPKLPLMPFKKNLTYNATFTVLAEETVKVPAGKFRDCLKVKLVIDCGKVLGHQSKTSQVMWLKESVGEVKTEITYGDGQTHHYALKSAKIHGKTVGGS